MQLHRKTGHNLYCHCHHRYHYYLLLHPYSLKKSSFSVPEVLEVQLESFKNPVSGEEQDTKIQIPKGFIWKLAEAAKSKIMRITTPFLNFHDSGLCSKKITQILR